MNRIDAEINSILDRLDRLEREVRERPVDAIAAPVTTTTIKAEPLPCLVPSILPEDCRSLWFGPTRTKATFQVVNPLREAAQLARQDLGLLFESPDSTTMRETNEAGRKETTLYPECQRLLYDDLWSLYTRD